MVLPSSSADMTSVQDYDASTTCGLISDEDRSRHAALFDAETGLPTGALLLDRLRSALVRGRREGTDVAVYFLDELRDLRGGPVAMVQIAQRLQAKLRPTDTVARVGPRAVVVVCGDLRRDEDAAIVGRRLVQYAEARCSWGIAYGRAFEDPEELLAQAYEQVRAVAATSD